MADVARITPEVRTVKVPAPLRDLPAWLVWAYEQYPGEPKPRKTPQYSMGGRRHGRQGSPEDRAKLTTFAVARDAAARRGLDGVGLALLPDLGIVALDFDNCVSDGAVNEAVLSLVQGTYAELSPSGRGVRAVFTGAADLIGNRKSKSLPDRFGAEVFSSSGFVTFTGWALDHVDLLGLEDRVAPLPQRVIDFCRERFGESTAPALTEDFTAGFEPTLGLSEVEIQEALAALDPDISRDEWIRVGMALHHEFQGSEDGFALWDGWSWQGTKYPGDEALRQQWDSFERRKGPGRRQVTMASVLAMARDARAADSKRVAVIEEVQAQAEAIAASSQAVGPSTPPDYAGKFPVRSAASMVRQKPLEWIIKGIIPDADIGTLFGASGSGKSFLALDLAAHIACGEPWRGHKVKRGKVVIIAAEGGGGYGKRIAAYCQHHGLDAASMDIGVITVPPNLLEAEDIGELAASVKLLGGVSLVIIDTLAQVTPGANENASEDMGRALANAMVLRRATGAMVLLVHHAGKDLARGARGWSGLKGAMDVEIEVSRDEVTGAREMRLSKMKDGEDGVRFGFSLETVVLGMDEDGDETTSCVAVEDELKPRAPPGARGRSQVVERDIYELAVLDYAAAWRGGIGIRKEKLIEAVVETIEPPEDKGRDRRLQNVARAVTNLLKEGGPVGMQNDFVVFY